MWIDKPRKVDLYDEWTKLIQKQTLETIQVEIRLRFTIFGKVKTNNNSQLYSLKINIYTYKNTNYNLKL
jgi:hypothetical protein